jgi:hypothetical protein
MTGGVQRRIIVLVLVLVVVLDSSDRTKPPGCVDRLIFWRARIAGLVSGGIENDNDDENESDWKSRRLDLRRTFNRSSRPEMLPPKVADRCCILPQESEHRAIPFP